MQRSEWLNVGYQYLVETYEHVSARIFSAPRKTYKNKTNQQRLDDIEFCDDDIPSEYIDETHQFHIMDDPVLIDNKLIVDYRQLQAWWISIDKWNINPITNIACTSIKFLPKLKEKIDTFVRNKEIDNENNKKVINAHLHARKMKNKAEEIRQQNKLKECKDLREELLIQLEPIIDKSENKPADCDDEKSITELLNKIDELNEKIRKLEQQRNRPTFFYNRLGILDILPTNTVGEYSPKISFKEDI